MKLIVFFLINININFMINEAFTSSAESNGTMCLSFNSTVSSNETVVNCGSSYCYALWDSDINKTTVIKLKGCFTLSESNCKGDYNCISNKIETSYSNLFCCCKENYCNKDVRWNPSPSPNTTDSTIHEDEDNRMFLILICTLFLLFSIVLLLLKRKIIFSCLCNISSHPQPAPVVKKFDSLQLIEIKACGKFGAVWKATFNNQIVAVKVMSVQEKQSWLTEQEVYSLPSISHENVLEYIGAEKRGDNYLASEFYLITAFHELGSLHDFLKVNTVSWEQLCRIVLTMARGLAHLHKFLAHRDFKSSNVLLKSDLTACIADFGLALIFKSSKSRQDTHSQTMVGTRRYMAPEVLEGAIHFSRDSYLRIDMYAFALVLWELASRCFFQEMSVQDYKLPFEEEVGQHPTLEDIQEIVVHKKQRPIIRNNWRQHEGFNVLCTTMEECWDHDADARLSASCILERMNKISLDYNSDLIIKHFSPI